MPRQARLDFEGCLHHVINRGLDRQIIFRDKGDYEIFKESLERFVVEDGICCYGWVLMPNHFHLVLKTGRVPLSTFMSRLQTSYAGAFNRKHRRVGKLFQNRYKSIVCDEEVYFRELLAYVHLNPLRAGLVKSFEELSSYRWSGHRAVLGLEKEKWQKVKEVEELFGRTPREGRKRYLEYLREKRDLKAGALSGGGLIRSAGGLSLALQRGPEEREEYDTRILGGGDFVKEIEKKVGNIERPIKTKAGLSQLVKAVSSLEGIPMEEITTHGKSTDRASKARAIISYLAVVALGEKKNVVAESLRVTPLAVTRLFRRGFDLVGPTGAQKKLEELKIV